MLPPSGRGRRGDSVKIKINSGNGRAQRQASARMPGSPCRNSRRKASGDRGEPRRAAALTAICNVGPCTTARSIISDTACAASRPPIVARPSIAAACSETIRRVPNPAKRRHSVASAGTAPASRRRPASAARLWLSARLRLRNCSDQLLIVDLGWHQGMAHAS